MTTIIEYKTWTIHASKYAGWLVYYAIAEKKTGNKIVMFNRDASSIEEAIKLVKKEIDNDS
jgi:hypothetical protein